jgi:tRNA nucleotidyltransferase (CCA-adding enzyme)
MESRDAIEGLVVTEPSVASVAEALEGVDEGVWLVGGAVRDLLLGRSPAEVDLVVERGIDAIVDRLHEVLGGTVEFHDRFGTAAIAGNFVTVDVASSRSEIYSQPGALPTVSPATLREDLNRRDFTINAIAVGLSASTRGETVSHPLAFADLESGALRVLHAKSFEDDPTRLWRMARYAGRLGLMSEPDTLAWAHRAVAEGALATISGARLGAEILRCVSDKEPHEVIRQCEQLGLFGAVGLRANPSAVIEDAQSLLDSDHDVALLRVIGLFAGVGSSQQLANELEIGSRLAAAASEGERIAELVEHLQAAPSLSALHLAARRASREAVAVAGTSGAHRAALRWFEKVEGRTLPFGGEALVGEGISGPAVAKGLDEAFALMLDMEESDDAVLLEVALKAARDWE